MGKPEGNVVAQFAVAGQDDEAGSPGAEDGVGGDGGATIFKHVITLFTENGPITHVRHHGSDIVIVHQLRISKCGREKAEQAADLVPMERHLVAEFPFCQVFKKARQRMVVRFIEKL